MYELHLPLTMQPAISYQQMPWLLSHTDIHMQTWKSWNNGVDRVYPHGTSKHRNKGNWQANITFSEQYKINSNISTTLKIIHSIKQCPTSSEFTWRACSTTHMPWFNFINKNSQQVESLYGVYVIPKTAVYCSASKGGLIPLNSIFRWRKFYW
jgi:hypothetical protein